MSARRWFFALLSAVIMLFALSVSAQGQQPQGQQPEYRLAPGDTIRIQVFQNPDFTLETRVTESGVISYPLVGAVRVGGLTLAAAEQAIAKALRDGGFMKQPQVIIVLLQNRGNQVSVLGQVNRPGRFVLEAITTRLSEMIANAGGIAPSGADVVILTGVRDGKPFRREIDVPGIYLNNSPQNDVALASGDVIYVDRGPVFYIYGEIQRPGSYRVERNMTVRQALAQAGGLTPRGTDRGLGLFRRGSDNAVEALKSPDLGDPVRSDDVIYVPKSLF